MKRDPFEVLGIPQGADDNTVKNAYRELARRYSVNGETPDGAKMREIDDAYDSIILSRTGGGSSSQQSSYSQQSYQSYSAPSFGDIRAKLGAGKVDEADALLDNVPVGQRTAEWYYLKGTVSHRRGWLEDAASNFERAYRQEPNNAEYRRAYENVTSDRSGGYRTERRTEKSTGCSACDMCSGLLCADCCCECMGGDCIPCC